MGLTEEVAGGGTRDLGARVTVKARSQRASRGPWARRIVSAVGHPVLAFRDSLDEEARGMIWRPVVVLMLASLVVGIITDPEEAVASILVVPFAFLVVLAIAACFALPVHFVARRFLGGRGTWMRTLHALLWATTLSAPLGVAASVLDVASEGMDEGSGAQAACLGALLVLGVAGLVLQCVLASRFVAMVHALPTWAGFVALISGSISAIVVVVTLVLAGQKWPEVAFEAFKTGLQVLFIAPLLLAAAIVAATAWQRFKT